MDVPTTSPMLAPARAGQCGSRRHSQLEPAHSLFPIWFHRSLPCVRSFDWLSSPLRSASLASLACGHAASSLYADGIRKSTAQIPYSTPDICPNQVRTTRGNSPKLIGNRRFSVNGVASRADMWYNSVSGDMKGNAMSTCTKFDLAGWVAKVRADGYSISVRGSVVSISKRFGPGNTDGFVDCDMMAGGYLCELPQTSAGSMWGTDGGSIGGMSALRTGVFTLNRSGISKRVCAKLATL